MYAVPGSNKLFNVAFRGKCLPTIALISFYSPALYQKSRCKQSVIYRSVAFPPKHFQIKKHFPT